MSKIQFGKLTMTAIAILMASSLIARAGDISLKQALSVANAAISKCTADGYRVSVAVIGRSGMTIALLGDAGAGPHTRGSSTGKAFSSAGMDRPTAALAALIKDKPELAGLRDMDLRLVILGGGLPIKLNSKLVGCIGVGCAPGGHLDEACAQAGLAAIGAM